MVSEGVKRALAGARSTFGTKLVDAVSQWLPRRPPVFFVNEDMPADRERLSLCHELGHIIMHGAVRPDMESEANAFAAEFLMPAAEMRHQLVDLTLHRLAALKPHWKVSMQALLKRAGDLEAISAGKAKYLWMQIAQAGYRTREPPELDLPHEAPGILQEMVDVHLKDFGYTVEQLAALFAMHEGEVRSIYRLECRSSDPVRRLRVVK